MSRVTIGDIYNDVNDTSYFRTLCAADIEVVPRKMVEMIIEECKKNEEALLPYHGEPYEDGQDCAYTNIRAYAESLLDEFEEDE